MATVGSTSHNIPASNDATPPVNNVDPSGLDDLVQQVGLEAVEVPLDLPIDHSHITFKFMGETEEERPEFTFSISYNGVKANISSSSLLELSSQASIHIQSLYAQTEEEFEELNHYVNTEDGQTCETKVQYYNKKDDLEALKNMTSFLFEDKGGAPVLKVKYKKPGSETVKERTLSLKGLGRSQQLAINEYVQKLEQIHQELGDEAQTFSGTEEEWLQTDKGQRHLWFNQTQQHYTNPNNYTIKVEAGETQVIYTGHNSELTHAPRPCQVNSPLITHSRGSLLDIGAFYRGAYELFGRAVKEDPGYAQECRYQDPNQPPPPRMNIEQQRILEQMMRAQQQQ